MPEKNLNYRTQLLHSHLRTAGSESSTHLKINYNDLMPLVAGIHWKSPSEHSLQKKWEGKQPLPCDTHNELIGPISSGMFNMDTPWLHVYTAHKLSQLQQRTFRLTSELTVSKWLSIRNLLLEAFLMDGSGEKEARLKVHTPAVTYIRVRRREGLVHLQLGLKGHHVWNFISSSSAPPGSRMGCRREANHKSFSVRGHAVDAAAERKLFFGEL